MKLQTIHLRINDAATGKPTPCRIRITDSDGAEYAPHGRPLEFSARLGEDVGGHLKLGQSRWWSIDGACEIALPAGELRVQARQGIDRQPIDEVVTVPWGKMALRFALKSADVVQRPGTLSVDMRCHGGSPHAAALDAAAEGLDVANLLIEPRRYLGSDGKDYECIPNCESFSGQAPALAAHGSQVIVNSHNRHPVLGSLGLLHCHRAVYPLTFGGGDASDDWSLDDWADQCHRKDGYVVWTDPFGKPRLGAGEALAVAILGKVDAYEVTPDNVGTALQLWYRLLSAGVDLSLVGGSGRTGNGRPVGAMRTLFWNQPGEYRATLRAGPICVTNGPRVMCGNADGTWVAQAVGLQKFDQLEIVFNGHVVASEPASPAEDGGPTWVAAVARKMKGGGWVAARVVSNERSMLDEATPIFGHTPAYRVGDVVRNPQAVEFLQGHLRRGREWVDEQGRFENPKSKVHLLEVFDAAIDRLIKPV